MRAEQVPDSGIQRIASAFADSGKRAAFMPYMMGGFPDLATSRGIGEAYAAAGADLVELGVPFSDPLADGPSIQAAGTTALREGATVEEVLQLGGALSASVPVILMAYANHVLGPGPEGFARDLVALGISGLIVPDLPLEEAPALLEACDEASVALVPLIAPTTPEERLGEIGSAARGFVYTVAVTGTTGERDVLDGLPELLDRARSHTEVPVAVGFGISTPEQAAAAAAAGADGVIVGSRLVRAAAEADDPPASVAGLVGEFAAALGG
jgi:tryptophan synthase alpha chain